MKTTDTNVKLIVKHNDNIICDIDIINNNGVKINSSFNPVSLFKYYSYIKNDILLNNIDTYKLFEYLNRIYTYTDWLENTYKPKYQDMPNFMYQVYLWVREDLRLFCIYSGLKLFELVDSKMEQIV